METLEYFLRRLGSQQTHQRLRALKGLRMVLSDNQPGIDNEDSNDGVEIVAMDVDGDYIPLQSALKKSFCFKLYHYMSENLS